LKISTSWNPTWGQFFSGIGIAYLKKNAIGIDRIGIEVCYKKSFLVQKYFFHDNLSWNIFYSE